MCGGEHLLFCKQYPKMCPSAYRVSGSPGLGRGREVGDVLAKIDAGFGFLLSPHRPQRCNMHLY